MKCARCCTPFILLALGGIFLLLLLGSLLLAYVGFPIILDDEIAKSVRLEEDTEQWDRFIELPFPVDFKIYIFEVTNPDDVLNGAKPSLVEKGPYIYKQYRHKIIEGYDDVEDTVTYRQNYTFEFDEARSIGKDTDIVTVVNPAMMTIIQKSTNMEKYLLNNCLQLIFPNEYSNLFINVSVKTLLFDGIDFSIDYPANPLCFITNWIIRTKADGLRNSKPIYDENNTLTNLQFSFFGFKNNQDDGLYTVNRGIDDVTELGSISRWNNSKYLNFWGQSRSVNNDSCSIVRGTDSTLYPPNIEKDTTFEIFSTDICRSVQINYKGSGSYRDIDASRFETDNTTLRSSLQLTENDCFCTKQSLDLDGQENCYLDGVIDMAPCFGAKVLFSFPHFLWADEKYQKTVDGLQPDEDKHKIFLLVEPNTGTPLQGAKRVQLNIVLRPEPYVNIARTLPKAYLPLLWIEEGLSLNTEYIDKLNDQYFNKVKIVDGVKIALIVVFAVLTVVFGGYGTYKKLRKDKNELK